MKTEEIIDHFPEVRKVIEAGKGVERKGNIKTFLKLQVLL
jgi:hypothetical protein